MKNGWKTRTLIVLLASSTVLDIGRLPIAAHAGEKAPGVKGRRNSTLLLGALTLYGLKSHDRTLFLAAGASSGLAYSETLRPLHSAENPTPPVHERSVLDTPSPSASTSLDYGEPGFFAEPVRGGRKDTAIGAAQVGAYGLFSGKRTMTWIGATATFLSIRRYRRSKKKWARSQRLQQESGDAGATPVEVIDGSG